MITRITQTFIKLMRGWVAGDECGKIIEKMFVKMEPVNWGSEAMAEGTYFEFLVTGSMGKAGTVPVPEYMEGRKNKKRPEDLTVLDMTADYRRAHFNALKVKQIMRNLHMKIVEYNKRYVYGRFEGDIDIVVEFTEDSEFGGKKYKTGDRIVIDLKYSGLLNDKYSKLGWMFSEIQKEYHGTQAIQYNIVTQGLGFYFWVVGNTNKELEPGSGKFEAVKMKVFNIAVNDWDLNHHIDVANQMMDKFKSYADIGFGARPSYNRCAVCPIRGECDRAHVYPHPEVIEL